MNDATAQLSPEEREARFTSLWRSPAGFAGWFASVNYQPMGKRYMITALMFFAVAGVLSLFIRAQLTVSDANLLGPDVYNEIFTMHGSTMMYLFAVPFVEGLALYLIPLMIGARDMAFPRLTNFGYWLYLAGGLVMYTSFVVGRVPDAGWFAYTPLSGPEYAGLSLDFWLLGLSLVEIGGIGAAAEIVVTILKLRAPGMAIHRMPLFVWSWLVAGVMILFGFTPLLMATLMLELDRALGTRFFDPEQGGSSLLWQHLFWFFGHPEVYIIFLPATGIVSTVVPTFARRPIVAYTLIVAALVVTGFVSFGLWVHHMFTTGLPEVSLLFFAAASFMIAIASGTQVFAWIATLWGSRPRYDTPLLYILGFLFIFVIGGLTGVMVATLPFDGQVHDTYFVVAHFHYVLIGGAVFPMFAGLYYWLPKVSGRMPIEPWGKVGFWLAFIGFNVTFFPMHIMGFFGMPRRVYTYPAELGIDGLNIVATIGSAIVGAGFALALGNLGWSAWRGRDAGDDPWGAGTLEWAVSSPPPTYSARRPAVVRGLYPVWRNDAPDPDAAALEATSEKLALAPLGWRAVLVTDAINGRPQALQTLPGPTYLPFVASVALIVTAIAVLLKSYGAAAVLALVAAGMLITWLRRGHTLPREEADALEARLGLPLVPYGSRSTVWCGMICLGAILATALGTLVYSYFYLRLYSDAWPQDGLRPPNLGWPLVAYGALGVSVVPLVWAIISRRGGWRLPLSVALAAVAAMGAAFIVVLFVWLLGVGFSPTENAYASAFFALNWLALAMAATGLVLVVSALVDTLTKGPPGGESRVASRLMLRLQAAELFWLYTVATGAIVFATAFLSPHVL